jgi:hypothetical protein
VKQIAAGERRDGTADGRHEPLVEMVPGRHRVARTSSGFPVPVMP